MLQNRMSTWFMLQQNWRCSDNLLPLVCSSQPFLNVVFAIWVASFPYIDVPRTEGKLLSQLVDVVCLGGSLASVLLMCAADLFGDESALVTRLHMGLIQFWNQLSIQSFTVSLTPHSLRWRER